MSDEEQAEHSNIADFLGGLVDSYGAKMPESYIKRILDLYLGENNDKLLTSDAAYVIGHLRFEFRYAGKSKIFIATYLDRIMTWIENQPIFNDPAIGELPDEWLDQLGELNLEETQRIKEEFEKLK